MATLIETTRATVEKQIGVIAQELATENNGYLMCEHCDEPDGMCECDLDECEQDFYQDETEMENDLTDRIEALLQRLDIDYDDGTVRELVDWAMDNWSKLTA